jgi:hypothetical protein
MYPAGMQEDDGGGDWRTIGVPVVTVAISRPVIGGAA